MPANGEDTGTVQVVRHRMFDRMSDRMVEPVSDGVSVRCGTGMCCRHGGKDTRGGCDGTIGIKGKGHVCAAASFKKPQDYDAAVKGCKWSGPSYGVPKSKGRCHAD